MKILSHVKPGCCVNKVGHRCSNVLPCLFRFKCMDDLLSSACQSAEAIYRVLYWDNHTKSSRSVAAHVRSHGMLGEQIKMDKAWALLTSISTQ